MSGGSLDYFYHKVDEMGNQLNNKENTPMQRAFGLHLIKVAKALHDIEWVMSGDYGDGDDEKAIKEVLGDSANSIAFQVLQDDVKKLILELEKYIK